MLILVMGILVIGIGFLLGKYKDNRDKQIRLAQYENRRRRKRKR